MTPAEKRRLDYLDAKNSVLEFVLITAFGAMLTPLPDDQIKALLKMMEGAPITVPPDSKLSGAEIDALMVNTAAVKANFYAALRDKVAELRALGIGTG